MLVKIYKPKQVNLKLNKMSVNSSLIKKLKLFEKYIHTEKAKETLIHYLSRISKTDFECYYDKYKYFFDKYQDKEKLQNYLQQKSGKIKEMIQKYKTNNNTMLLFEYILPNLVLLIEYSLTNNYIDELINEF